VQATERVSATGDIRRSIALEPVPASMVFPSLTDPMGLFEYLIALIILTALFMGAVLVLGLGPF